MEMYELLWKRPKMNKTTQANLFTQKFIAYDLSRTKKPFEQSVAGEKREISPWMANVVRRPCLTGQGVPKHEQGFIRRFHQRSK